MGEGARSGDRLERCAGAWHALKIVFLAPRNDLSGNRKLITKLAHELADRHSVSIRYPIVPHRDFTRLLKWRPGTVALLRNVGADCWRYLRARRWAYATLMDARVRVKPYLASLRSASVADYAVVIYSTVYQPMELARIPRTGSTRMYCVLHEQGRSEGDVVVDAEVIRRACKDADHVVAPSRATERELALLGVRSEGVIPAGVDTSVFCPGSGQGSGLPSHP